METNTIQEQKIIIAQFMGYIDNGCSEDGFLIDPETNNDVDLSEFNYVSDWNDLMTVVQKIESLELTDIDDFIKANRKNGLNRLDATYEAVVSFLKWHNSQQTQG